MSLSISLRGAVIHGKLSLRLTDDLEILVFEMKLERQLLRMGSNGAIERNLTASLKGRHKSVYLWPQGQEPGLYQPVHCANDLLRRGSQHLGPARLDSVVFGDGGGVSNLTVWPYGVRVDQWGNSVIIAVGHF